MEIETQLTAVEWLEVQIKNTPTIENLMNQLDAFIKEAKEMQDEQMQLTWNNAIDAVQKDKWHSYYEFYNNNFKSE